MKNLTLLAILFLLTNIALAQSFCDHLEFEIPTIKDCTGRLRTDVGIFNIMARYYGITDTISYTCSERDISYLYKNEVIADFDYDPTLCGKKLMLRGYHNSFEFKLLASIPTKDNKSIVYEVIRPEKQRNRLIYKQYQEDGMLPYGKYVEKNCEGQIVTEGEYTIINKPSSDSYYWYDGTQRQTVTKEINSDKTSVRSGEWKFYNDTGELVSTEHYPNKKSKKVVDAGECYDATEIENVWNYYNAEKVSPAISIYNHVNAMLGRTDNMSVDITQRGLVYYRNGEIVSNPFFALDDGHKSWAYQMENTKESFLIDYSNGTLNVYTESDKGKGEWMKLYNNSLDIYHLTNHKITGSFERWSCQGHKLIAGNLKTIDTLYTIEVASFNPNTYEEEMVVTEIDHEVRRAGVWNYYNEKGEVIAEENYQGSIDGSLYASLLCATMKDDFNALSKSVPNSFLLFNSICHMLKLDHWVTDERVIAGKGYYYNGRKTVNVEFMPKANHVDAYKLTAPGVVIEIEQKTNNQAALGKLEDKIKIIFKASITYTDGRKDEINFANGRIKLVQTLNQQLGGRYEERGCDGRLLLEGQYCQIDSFHMDTASYFNPDTYEEVVTISELDTYSKQSGIWRHYDAEGVLIKEEDFGVCK